MPQTRAFFLPAAGIGLVLAIAFFKLYGPLSRPSVPTPVSTGITTFAPGAFIGKPVKDIKGYPAPYWVQHVGYVSDVNRPGLTQVRFLMPAERRDRPTGDPKSESDAVELVAPGGTFNGHSPLQLIIARFGTRQKDGCLLPAHAGLPRRQVEYWTTKNDRGGMAFIYDWIAQDTAAERIAYETRRGQIMREYELARAAGQTIEPPKYEPPRPRFALTSLFFWTGKFEGARTLRGNYVPRLCAEIETPPPTPDSLRASIIANDSLLIQLGYRPTGE